MALDARLILAGQTPNLTNALMQGSQAAQQTNAVNDQNKLRQLYQQQGAGIANGDQNALNALAGLNPQASLDVQGSRLNMDNTRQVMDVREQTQARLSRQEARAVEEQAAKMSAQERAAQAAKIEEGVKMGLMVQTPEEWDQMAQANGAPELVGQFANREALAAKYMSVAEIMKGKQGADDPAAIQTLRIRAQEAGLTPGTKEYQQFMLNGGGQTKGMRIVSDGKGGFTMEQDGGISQEGGVKPSSPEAMISSIDGILSDPALKNATGMLAWTQNIPGTGARRFGARTKQLEGQAFLQAFESLKGGGQITEIEGTKATQAIGRLDTAQSAEDYTQALTELREILVAAQQRPIGWAYNQKDPTVKQGGAVEAGTTEDGYRFKGGDPSDPANWEKVQ